jgi:hypothetical protein
LAFARCQRNFGGEIRRNEFDKRRPPQPTTARGALACGQTPPMAHGRDPNHAARRLFTPGSRIRFSKFGMASRCFRQASRRLWNIVLCRRVRRHALHAKISGMSNPWAPGAALSHGGHQ